jgi:hypothetical protein
LITRRTLILLLLSFVQVLGLWLRGSSEDSARALLARHGLVSLGPQVEKMGKQARAVVAHNVAVHGAMYSR